jgi:large subunit ribosomal protein L33
VAKVKGGVIKLVSLAGTGFFYATRKNPKAATKKLLLRKYDPFLQRHTLFRVRDRLRAHRHTITALCAAFVCPSCLCASRSLTHSLPRLSPRVITGDEDQPLEEVTRTLIE